MEENIMIIDYDMIKHEKRLGYPIANKLAKLEIDETAILSVDAKTYNGMAQKVKSARNYLYKIGYRNGHQYNLLYYKKRYNIVRYKWGYSPSLI